MSGFEIVKDESGDILWRGKPEEFRAFAGLFKWIERGEINVKFKESEIEAKDDRPDPMPRKLPLLRQVYQTWYEFMEMRKRHRLRGLSIVRGKSNMDAGFEGNLIAISDALCESFRVEMIKTAEAEAGEIWEYLIAIKGLGTGNLAAQLLSLIDDIGKFDTVAKLWAYSVGGVDENGRMVRGKRGEVSPVNKDIAALMYNIQDQFVRQRTYPYRDFYDQYKERKRSEFPEPVAAVPGKNVPKKYPWKFLYTDSHIDRMAKRAMGKRFLRDLWLTWRKIEGLPISVRYEDRGESDTKKAA